jgi:hypothetical protein
MAGRVSILPNPIFTPVQVANTIHRFYRVKIERQSIDSDGEANVFVAEASRFTTEVATATQPAYDRLIGDDSQKTDRLANLTNAFRKIIDANKASLHVVPRVFNHSFRGAPDVDVVMYRGGVTPGALSTKTVRVSFDPAESRFLDRAAQVAATPPDGITPADRNLNDISRHDPDSHKPIFLLGDPADPTNPPIALDGNFNQPGYVSFTIDLPSRSVKEPNRQNNYDGFWFYVIDPDHPENAPVLAPKPPLPLLDVKGTLLQPDASCTEAPDIRITQGVLKAAPNGTPLGAENTDRVALQPGEAATLRVHLANDSALDLSNVKICPSLLADLQICAQVGSVAAGHDLTQDFAFIASKTSQITDAITTAFTPELGIRTSPPLRVIVGCEPYKIVPLVDDPNPDRSVPAEIMRGGYAIRYYRVVDFTTGEPVANAAVTIDLTDDRGGRKTFIHYRTDADGYVQQPPSVFTPNILGVPLDGFNRGFDVYIDPSTPVGSQLTATLTTVNGVAPYCSGGQSFDLKVIDRSYQRSWKGGGSIGAAGTVEVGFQGKVGAGISLALTETPLSGRQLLSLGRTDSIEGGVLYAPLETGGVVEVGPIKFGGTAKITAGAVEQGLVGDQFDFKFDPGATSLNAAEGKAFGALFLKQLLGSGPILQKIYEVIKTDSVTTSTNPHKSSETIGLGFELSASGALSGTAGVGFTKVYGATPQHPKSVVTGLMNYGLDLSAGAGAKVGIQGTTVFNPQTQETTSGYELRGQIDLDFALSLGAGAVKAGQTATGVEKRLAIMSGIKAGLKGTPLAENWKLSVTRDTRLAPTKVALSVGSAKNFGFQVNAVGQDLVQPFGAGDSTTIKFTIADPDAAARALNELPTLKATQMAPVAVPLGLAAMPTLIGPIVVGVEMASAVNLLKDIDADFDVTVEDGVGISVPFSFAGSLFGIGAKFTSAASFDKTITWTSAKGKVKKGKFYPTENYLRDPLLPTTVPSSDDLVALVQAAFGQYGTAIAAVFDVVPHGFVAGINEMLSRHTAQLLFDGTNETPFDAALVSFTYTPTTAGPLVRRPQDVAGRGDRPHYGVGGFHHFGPDDHVLASPGTLTFFYKDYEIAGLDESSMAIYRWNNARSDWDYLGGVVDPAAHTVRVSVDRFGLYTAAPAMPSGIVTFTGESTAGGTALEPRTTVGYTSAPVRTNAGQVVADGTKFTVFGADPSTDLTPFGTVLTGDEDPSLDGVQVSSHGGVVRFAVDYPAASGVALPFTYSVDGTAISKDPLPLRTQP